MQDILRGLDLLSRKMRKCPRRPFVWNMGDTWWVEMPGTWLGVGHIHAMNTWKGAIDVALLWVYAEYTQGDGSLVWRKLAKYRSLQKV